MARKKRFTRSAKEMKKEHLVEVKFDCVIPEDVYALLCKQARQAKMPVDALVSAGLVGIREVKD